MKKGFTLIELMVVISIIGILSAIAILRFMNITRDAKIAQIQANRRNLQTAVHMYMAREDKKPTEIVNQDGEGPDYNHFVDTYMAGKIPSLPGVENNDLVGDTQDKANVLDEIFIITAREFGFSWLITDEGNVYPMVTEEEYEIKFDKF